MATTDRRSALPRDGAEVLELLKTAEALHAVSSGLRDNKMRALRLIMRAGRRGITQAAMASGLDLSHAAVSRLCDALEVEGLIQRVGHPLDRRMKTLHLSDTGAAQIDHCDRATLAKATACVPAVNVAETEPLSTLFHQMVAQMQSSPCTLLCQQCLLGGC